MLGGQTHHSGDEHGHGGFILLADDEHVGSGLAAEGDAGGVFDGNGLTEECGGGGRPLVGVCSMVVSFPFLCRSLGALPSKTTGSSILDGGIHFRGDAIEPLVAFFIGEPGDLEGAIGFDEAALVVVDRFAGAGEEAAAELLSPRIN